MATAPTRHRQVSRPVRVARTSGLSPIAADANNSGSATSSGSTPAVAIGTAQRCKATCYYLVGGSTNDQLCVSPIGSSQTGSCGINVNGQLNGACINQNYSQSFTTIYVFGFNGNDSLQFSSSLTIGAVISEGNGNDQILLDDGNNNVTLGSGNDTVEGTGCPTNANGNNTIVAGNGTDTVELGNGNDTIALGSGTDTVQLGNGANTVTAGAAGSVDKINVQVGNGAGNVVTLLGNGADQVVVGNGNNDSVSINGNGNDLVEVGNGNNDSVSIAGNGNETIQTGTGTGK